MFAEVRDVGPQAIGSYKCVQGIIHPFFSESDCEEENPYRRRACHNMRVLFQGNQLLRVRSECIMFHNSTIVTLSFSTSLVKVPFMSQSCCEIRKTFLKN